MTSGPHSYRIIHNDSGETVLIDGAVDYPIETVEAEIRDHPEQFALIPDPNDYEPHGLDVRLVAYDEDDGWRAVPPADAVTWRLEALRMYALADRAVEVWRGGPSKFDAEEFDGAMGDLSRALPSVPSPRVDYRPDDPF